MTAITEPATFGAFIASSIAFLRSIGCAESATLIQAAARQGLYVTLSTATETAAARITAEMARAALVRIGVSDLLVNACEVEFFGVIVSGAQSGLEREAFMAAFGAGVRAAGVRVFLAGARAPKNPYVTLAVMTGTALFTMGCDAGVPPRSAPDMSLPAVMNRCYLFYRMGCFAAALAEPHKSLRPLSRDEWRTQVFHPMIKKAKERFAREKAVSDQQGSDQAQQRFESGGVHGGRIY